MFARQRAVVVQMVDCAVVRKLLANGIVHLVRYLARFSCGTADDYSGQIRDVDRSGDYDYKRYEQGYQRNLSGTDSQLQPGRTGWLLGLPCLHFGGVL